MLVVGTRKGNDLGVTRGAFTGAAWLSSARAVRCWVKSRNERNPRRQLDLSGETAAQNAEDGGDDVKSARLLRPGLHTRYNGRYNGLRKREPEPIPSKPVAIRTGGGFAGLAPPRGFATRCTAHCSTCVALDIKAMMT